MDRGVCVRLRQRERKRHIERERERERERNNKHTERGHTVRCRQTRKPFPIILKLVKLLVCILTRHRVRGTLGSTGISSPHCGNTKSPKHGSFLK